MGRKRLYTIEEAKEVNRQRAKIYAKNLAIQALLIYGGECVCCGEAELKFLTLDHARQDGAESRKALGISPGTQFINWLRKRDWPKDLGLQILCANCHMAKDYRGGCPHKKEYVKPKVGRPRKDLSDGPDTLPVDKL